MKGNEFGGLSAAGGRGMDWKVRTAVIFGWTEASEEVVFFHSEWTLGRISAEMGKLKVAHVELIVFDQYFTKHRLIYDYGVLRATYYESVGWNFSSSNAKSDVCETLTVLEICGWMSMKGRRLLSLTPDVK